MFIFLSTVNIDLQFSRAEQKYSFYSAPYTINQYSQKYILNSMHILPNLR